MEDALFFLFFGGVVAAIITAFIVGSKREKARCQALSDMAQQLGLAYSEKGSESDIGAGRSFGALSRGRNRTISNIVDGSHSGVSIQLYDYSYVTGSGKNRSTHYLSVCQIESPNLSVPQFSLSPESFLHRIGEMLGMQDIDFEAYPDFSKSFLLKGALEDEVRMAFGDPVIRYFEDRKGMTAEGMIDTIALIRSGKLRAERMQSDIQDGLEMLKAFVDAGNTR